MTKFFFITTLVFLFNLNSFSQYIGKSIKNDIIDFYINKNEILKTDKQKILNSFEELVRIIELKDSSAFSEKKEGIYCISLNITHTTRLLLIYRNNNYSILSTENLIEVFTKVISFIKETKNINKEDIVKYFESVLDISRDNIKLEEINILEDPSSP